MLTCSSRSSLAAIVIVAIASVLVDQRPLVSSDDDAPGTSAQGPRLEHLLKERAATARKALDLTILRMKAGAVGPDALREPARLALEAALEAADSKKERVKILEDFRAAAKDQEKLASGLVKVGQSDESNLLAARAERLRIEIALERAQAGQSENKKAEDKKAADPKDVCILRGVVEASASARLFGRVTGVLQAQRVHIGDRVKTRDILAELDVPDLFG